MLLVFGSSLHFSTKLSISMFQITLNLIMSSRALEGVNSVKLATTLTLSVVEKTVSRL